MRRLPRGYRPDDLGDPAHAGEDRIMGCLLLLALALALAAVYALGLRLFIQSLPVF